MQGLAALAALIDGDKKRYQSLLRLWGIYCFSVWHPLFFIFLLVSNESNNKNSTKPGRFMWAKGRWDWYRSYNKNGSDLELETMHRCDQNRTNGPFCLLGQEQSLTVALVSHWSVPESSRVVLSSVLTPCQSSGSGLCQRDLGTSQVKEEIYFGDFVFSPEQNLTYVSVITDKISVNPYMNH